MKMKKSINIILFFGIILLLSGCFNNNKTEFMKLVSNIPTKLKEDYILIDKMNDETIKWSIDGEVLNDNIIKYFYTTEDVKLELKGELSNETVYKNITISKTNFVTSLVINTVNNKDVVSKDDYLRAELELEGAGFFDLNVESFRIRGRGNSTWGYVKKPYRLNFDESVSMLGMKPGKNYVLLAEHNDKSLMRNYVAHYLSQYLNLPHTLETRYVTLTLNGDYKGLYLMTEQVAVDKNRLNIDVSEDVEGGFLIELEREYDRAVAEGKENRDWFRMQNPNPYDRNNGGNKELYQELYYVVKSPKLKDYDDKVSSNKINYYKKYFSDFEDSILNDTYEEYINVENFIDYFILTELMKQVDVGYSSVFITKDKNEKMNVGPIWDFDISSGNGNYYAYGPKGYWVDYNPWFGMLIKRKGFEEKYIKRFNEIINLYFVDLINEINRVEKYISSDAIKNFKRWGMHLDDGFNPNPVEMLNLETHKEQVMYLVKYLTERKIWLQSSLNTKGYYGFMGDEDEGWI